MIKETNYQGNHIYEPENQNSWKIPEFLQKINQLTKRYEIVE